jgi:tetratricopeptide (TPR) repeat protein
MPLPRIAGGMLQFAGRPAEADAPERILRLTQPAHLAARYFQRAGFFARAAAGHLAGVLQDLGRLDEAGAEYAEVLAIRRRTLGDENPDTLDTRHAAAYLLRLRGQYAAAESEYRAVIAHQRAMVGDAHPTTLGTRHNLALVLQDQGRLDEAAGEYAEVFTIRHRLLGPTHHDTVETRRNLAIVRALQQNDA